MITKVKRSISGILLVLLLFSTTGSLAAEKPAGIPQRIISLSPCTTEILFGLGLGDKIVGVTRYCDFPEAAKTIAKVGGFLDPNYEEIIALKPDLVILLTSHRDAKRELEKMRVKTLTTPHETISDIHESIRLIGKACGASQKATEMVADLNRQSEAVRQAVKKCPGTRVLICIGRDFDSGELAGMYMAGRNNFYDEIIHAAGGVNACFDKSVAYPQFSAEGVIELNPDVIIDLASHIKPGGKTAKEIACQWKQLRPVTAVREARVYVVVGNHALRPGPRYVQFLEELARLLHPEVFKKVAAHG